MIECLISAEKDCTERIDVNPEKVLRPIGTTFEEWNECMCSTEPAHWVTWKVVGYIDSFRGRSGDALLYERMEEIRLAEPRENK